MINIKILIVNTVPFRINGMSTCIFNYYDSMREMSNYRVDFVINSTIDESYLRKINLETSKIYVLKNRKKNVLSWRKELREIIKNNYDIIHIHGNSSLMYLETQLIKKSKCTSKVVVHGHSVQSSYPIMNRLFGGKFRKSYDYAFSASEEAGTWLFKSDFTVIKNGIDVRKFKYNPKERNRLRNELKISEDEKILLHIGLFNDQKNHSFLIKLFEDYSKKYSDTKLVLVGGGPNKEKINTQVRLLGIADKVIFIDQTTEIEKYYSLGDCFIFPSLFESLGIVLIEAQCSGLPCVVSENISKSACISGNITKLSLEASSELWIAAIRNHLTNPVSRYNGVKDIENADFDIHKNAVTLFDIYSSIIEREN